MILCVDIRSNSTTPQRVALGRMFKETGLRSPGTQLTKVQLEISVKGRHTEATFQQVRDSNRQNTVCFYLKGKLRTCMYRYLIPKPSGYT